MQGEESQGQDFVEETGADTSTAEGGSDLQALLQEAQAKADANYDLALRAQAELENVKRRASIDLEKAHKFALEKFASDLLPVIDSLEMGLSAGSAAGEDQLAKIVEGAELTLKMFADVLSKNGVAQVNPEGEKFNPEHHQAMATQPSPDVEPNTVIGVMQKGYLLNDRLIRPAMVMVSKAAD